jgi:hypothetical protein
MIFRYVMAYANFASTVRRWISISIVSLDGLSFYGSAWTFKLTYDTSRCNSTVTEHTPAPIKRLLTRSAPLHSVHPGRQAHHLQLFLPQQVVPVSSLLVLSGVPDVLWEGNVSSGSSPACPAAPLWRYRGIHIDTIHRFSVQTIN